VSQFLVWNVHHRNGYNIQILLRYCLPDKMSHMRICRSVGTAFSEQRNIWMNGPSVHLSAGSEVQATILEHARIEVRSRSLCSDQHLLFASTSQFVTFFLYFRKLGGRGLSFLLDTEIDRALIIFPVNTDCGIHSIGWHRAGAWHFCKCKHIITWFSAFSWAYLARVFCGFWAEIVYLYTDLSH